MASAPPSPSRHDFPGVFITLEGGEGVGKSTQARRLAAAFERLGREVVLTREPGGSPRAEAIRAVLLSGGARAFGPLAELALFASARADHVDRLIRPALARGAVVLCDRFADSSRVYQGSALRRPELVARLERVATGPCRPDLTLILDLPPEIGLARAERRGGRPDRFEEEDLGFHRRVRSAFRELAEAEPERCVLVAADGDAEAIASAIWSIVGPRHGA